MKEKVEEKTCKNCLFSDLDADCFPCDECLRRPKKEEKDYWEKKQ